MLCSCGCGRAAVARGLSKVCHQRQRRAAQRPERAYKPLLLVEPHDDIDVVYTVRLSEPDRAALDRIAHMRGLTAAALIRTWIRCAE